MTFVLRIPTRRAIARFRQGSLNPRDIYEGRLWQAWSPRRRAMSVVLRTVFLPLDTARALVTRRISLDQARLCWRAACRPVDAVWAGEYRAGAETGQLVPLHVKKGLDALLNPGSLPLRSNILLDKARFGRAMEAAGLPTPPTLDSACLDAPLPDWCTAASALIFKPGFGSQGRGIRRLDRQADGRWQAEGEAGTADLREWLVAHLGHGDVVQQMLRPDPGYAPLSPNAVPTLRIITCFDEEGEIEVVSAVLRMSTTKAYTDNFKTGGLASAVDIATGRITRSFQRGAGGRSLAIEHHPLTGERLEGLQLPLFDTAQALARSAHRAIEAHGFTIVGWDIGLTERGCVVIEGNWDYGIVTSQYIVGQSLCASRTGQLWAHHLHRIPAPVWRAAPTLMHSARSGRRGWAV